MNQSLLSLASSVEGERVATLPAAGFLSYLTAILPSEKRAVCPGMSHELPLQKGTPEEELELREFILLAVDYGALGFMREDVPTCNGMLVLSDVKRFTSSAAHPEASEPCAKVSANKKEASW